MIVDQDVPACIDRHTGLFKTEVVGVRAPSHRQEDMGSTHLGSAACAVHLRDYLRPARRQSDARRVETHADAFALNDVLDGRGHVVVLALNETWAHLDDGDGTAEAAEHLPELQADVA